MKLDKLCAAAGLACPVDGEASVTGFAIDNRKVAPGTVFGAFRGARFNGEDFIASAIEAGAVEAEGIHLLQWQQLRDGIGQLDLAACALLCGFEQVEDRRVEDVAPHHGKVAGRV